MPHPIEGAEQIARFLADLVRRAPAGVTFLEGTVNGQPGLVARQDGATVTVFAFRLAGDRITHIWAVRNPGKLRPWGPGRLTRLSFQNGLPGAPQPLHRPYRRAGGRPR
ncbi:MAG TPA: hypothetical protein VMC83_04690 [Streptosporangiaceae bacterium]|nr:hypothetical protein [Streptosporangiaceae bacterium]